MILNLFGKKAKRNRVGLRGTFYFTVRDSKGRVKERRKVRNLVTDAGRAVIAGNLNGATSAAAFTYIAVGTGSTAAAAGDTALVTESTTNGLGRAAATCTRATTDATNDTAQLDKTFSVTGTVAVTEAGIFNAASGPTLLARQVFSAVNVVNGDTLQIIYKIDVD